MKFGKCRSIRYGMGAVLLIFLFAVPVGAATIDWSSPASNGNLGLVYVVNEDLTITAKSGLADGDDPLFVSDKAGTVYLGNDLGGLDVGGMTANAGLGVQNAAVDSMTGLLNPGGSKGISGDGGDAREALIFTFTNPAGVDINSVSVNLVGLNYAIDPMTGQPTNNSDVIDLFLEFTPIENPSDQHRVAISFTTPTYLLDFSTLGLTGDFGSFALEATSGHFGVNQLTYEPNTPSEPIPEPATLLLLGSGLLPLLRRRLKRK